MLFTFEPRIAFPTGLEFSENSAPQLEQLLRCLCDKANVYLVQDGKDIEITPITTPLTVPGVK